MVDALRGKQCTRGRGEEGYVWKTTKEGRDKGGVRGAEGGEGEGERERCPLCLHVLELIYAALRVALADLAQSLVLVSALSDVLLVQDVVAG